ncbi:MAG: ATP-binding cassette domain-containing protein [Chitinophagales bacterium]|nr:ATP-binding cassette domain-containing protein [Chitinophagales bacterium]
MMNAIEVNNLSKMYRLGAVSTGTLSHDLNRWWHTVRGLEDPYKKVAEANARDAKGDSEYVWSLKDISFSVAQGEILGIVGRNGAGKSTLLKVLSKVTGPTSGSIKMKGRVASLLEVGTGFHPELTGRENLFLNGAILGMTKQEIRSKFDEIVAFSGVERYIDTPVKRYSSGMYVRLAFAVAAHLEPEILIVDEVLAVGDAEFQKKCLGKMKDVSDKEGRTVLFVSHNMTAVKSLCTKGLQLHHGNVKTVGDIDTVIDSYIAYATFASNKIIQEKNEGLEVKEIAIEDNGIKGNFDIDQPLTFTVTIESEQNFDAININLFFNAMEGGLIFATCSETEPLKKGSHQFTCTIPANTLNDIVYSIDLMVVKQGSKHLHFIKEVLALQGNEPKREGAWLGKFPGLIRPKHFSWNKKSY